MRGAVTGVRSISWMTFCVFPGLVVCGVRVERDGRVGRRSGALKGQIVFIEGRSATVVRLR